MVAVAVRDGRRHAARRAGRDDGIGFAQVASERFLEIQSLRSGLDGGQRHRVMLIRVPRRDEHEVGLHLAEHPAVVAEKRVPEKPVVVLITAGAATKQASSAHAFARELPLRPTITVRTTGAALSLFVSLSRPLPK